MNNLNTKQVNPGNGVDFSKIRKLSKSSNVPKFKNPAGKIGNTSNNADDFWTSFNNDVIKRWESIAKDTSFTLEDLNSFLKQNRALYRDTLYDGEAAVRGEGVKQYLQDFHNKYGFGNTDSFWGNMQYPNIPYNTGDRRPEDNSPFIGDAYYGTLTDLRRAAFFSDEELKRANNAVKSRGWKFVLDPTQNEGFVPGTDGRKFYMLAADKEPPTGTPTGTPTGDSQEASEYAAIDFIKPYKSGKWTGWEHLPFMLHNNLNALGKQYQSTLNTKVPLPEAWREEGVITDGYGTRSLLQLGLTEAAARNSAIANSSSTYEDFAKQHLLFESEVAPKYTSELARIQSNDFNQSTQIASQKSSGNTDRETEARNLRDLNVAGLYNILGNARSKYIAGVTNEINTTEQKLAESRRQYDLHEAINRDEYKANAINYVLQSNLLDAYNTYKKELEDGWKTDSALNYEGFFNYIVGGGEPDLSDEQLDIIIKNKYDLSKILPILELFSTENATIALWLSKYDNYLKQVELRWKLAEAEHRKNSALAAIDRKLYYSTPDDPALSVPVENTAIVSSYKKGGKTSEDYALDRLLKYLEHHRKTFKDSSDRINKIEERAYKKLSDDIKALDLETLYLLRAIFK